MEPLEKKIKGKLQQSKIELNTDELWKEVYPHIKPDRSKRYILFLFAGILWLISLVGVAWYIKSSNAAGATKLVEEQLNIESRYDSKSATNKNESLSSEEVANKISNDNLRLYKANLDKKDGIEVQRLQTVENIEKDKTQKKIPPTPFGMDSEFIDQISVRKDKTDFQDVYRPLTKTEDFDISNSKLLEKASLREENTSNKKLLEKMSISSIGQRLTNLSYSYPQPTITNEFKSVYSKPNPPRYSIYLQGGVFMTDRLLTYNGTEPIESHARWISEKPLESINAEFGLNYHITPQIQLGFGFNFLRINEKVEDTYSVTEKILLENVIIENIITSRGTEQVYGNIEVDRTTNTTLKAFNRYNDMALSLDATYKFNGKSFSPYIAAGLQQSIRSMQSGTWLLEDNMLYDLTDDDEGYLKSNYGLAMRVGVGTYLKLSELASLKIGARYIQYASPITKDNYELNQKYKLMGFNLGLNVNIN